MPDRAGPPRARVRWDELDLLRGVAGALMVVNHTGYKWLNEAQLADPAISALVFAGSCAPVVFFATSGVGHGLGSGSTRVPDRLGLLRKVAILLLADALLWLSPTQWYGLDFLGFIGLSMLALDPLRHARHPLRWALGGIVLVTILRFGVGEAVKGWPQTPTNAALRIALGIDPVEGVSYPVLPWIAYGLTGFVVGAVAKDARAWIDRRFAWVLAGLAIVLAVNVGATRVLVATGRAIHRWGYVSLAFYFVGFAAIAAALGLALVAARWGGERTRRLLDLPGLASLAVVPLHYVVIALVAAVLPLAALDRYGWLAATLVTLVVSFAGARAMQATAMRAVAARRAWLGPALLGAIAAAFIAKLIPAVASSPAAVQLGIVTAGQLLLCVAFALEGARSR
jgi:uncharacterized membrane protein